MEVLKEALVKEALASFGEAGTVPRLNDQVYVHYKKAQWLALDED